MNRIDESREVARGQMNSILERATELQLFATIVGIFLLFWYARETYLLRLATITGNAPSVRVAIHYDSARSRLCVENVEGRIAYNVRLGGFTGFMEQREADGTKALLPVR